MTNYKNSLTLEEARKLIYEMIESSDDYVFDNFWIYEFKNIKLEDGDEQIVVFVLERLLNGKKLRQVDKSNLNIILRRNWRRFLNVWIIERFFAYISELDRLKSI